MTGCGESRGPVDPCSLQARAGVAASGHPAPAPANWCDPFPLFSLSPGVRRAASAIDHGEGWPGPPAPKVRTRGQHLGLWRIPDHGNGSQEACMLKVAGPAPTGPSCGASSREVVAAPTGQCLPMGRCAPDVAFVWRAVLTLGLVLLYYCFSIGITFYNKWLTKVRGGPRRPLIFSSRETRASASQPGSQSTPEVGQGLSGKSPEIPGQRGIRKGGDWGVSRADLSVRGPLKHCRAPRGP